MSRALLLSPLKTSPFLASHNLHSIVSKANSQKSLIHVREGGCKVLEVLIVQVQDATESNCLSYY
jgi:hypothetical protein